MNEAYFNDGSGALTQLDSTPTSTQAAAGPTAPKCVLGFNASASNNIYGKADTVHPDALRVCCLIRYA